MLSGLLFVGALVAAWFGFGVVGLKVGERMERRGTAVHAEETFFFLFASGGVILVGWLFYHFTRP
jgi:hypothetical protein